jgi:hypothetical protein
VKRYTCYVDHCGVDHFHEEPEGHWCAHEDVAALEKRLAEATALLDAKTVLLFDAEDSERRLKALLARFVDEVDCDIYDDPCHQQLVVDAKALLAATPSPPAEPAPSLVAQIEAACDSVNGSYQHPDQLEQAVMQAFDRIRALLRAAREAGGR